LVERYRQAEVEYRDRHDLPPPEKRKVTLFSDNASAVAWIRRALRGDADLRIPAESRRVATNRCKAIVRHCEELNIELTIKHIPGLDNPADELTRVPEWVLKSVKKYMAFPDKLKALKSRALPMSGLRVPAEVVHEVHGTRARSAVMHSTALLSPMSLARQLTEPGADEGASESNCRHSVREGSIRAIPLSHVANGDLNRDPEESSYSSNPGGTGHAYVRPEVSMVQNSPCRQLTDLGRGGDQVNESVAPTAMPSSELHSMPAQVQGSSQVQGSMADVDAPELPMISGAHSAHVRAGTGAASLSNNTNLPGRRIRSASIAKLSSSSFLALSKSTHRAGRSQAAARAKEAKIKSFSAGCRFDEDGLRLIQSGAELQKILAVVHYHEGAQALHGIVKGIVSPQSPNGVGSGLLQTCRDFVGSCESCQMCRRMAGKKHSKAVARLEKCELARMPIRISFHGEDVTLSTAEVAEIRRQLRKEDESVGQARRLRFSKAETPFEQIHLDIVGPWQIGRDKLYLITCLDNFSGFVKASLFTECPRSSDCSAALSEFVGEAQFTPSKICVDNGPQFTGAAFKQAVASYGAVLEYSGAYAHWAAGKIERWHRVLNERVRAAIHSYRSTLRRKYLSQGKGNVLVPVSATAPLAAARVPTIWCGRTRLGSIQS
jgi:transposase InsO family protein